MDDKEVTWPSYEPDKLAGRLREALASAVAHSDRDEVCKNYAHLRDKYVIKARPQEVRADLRVRVLRSQVRESLRKLRLPEVDSFEQAVGAAIVQRADEIHFPSIIIAPNDPSVIMFYNWCLANSWFILNHYAEGITITKKDPGEIKWSPAQQD